MSRISGTAELLRLLILGGDIRAGERIVEVHVARRLGVERSALREALRRLEGEGLLVADDAGGMHVLTVDAQELADTLELRAALEALSAGLAARRVRDGDVAPRDLDHLETLADVTEPPLSADRNLHRAVAALGGNRLCRDALNHVWDRLVLAEHVPTGHHEHRELTAAILAGDEGEATAIARRHVLSAAPAARGASRAAPG